MRYFLLLFSFFSLHSLSSQLPDGSTAPDFTLMDLNNIEHHLYDITAQGKSVIIDFSATWCGICWNYHQGGALDHVHEMYGENGQNNVQVFWMEADANTNTNCVYGSMGCNFSSIGDWTEGIEYPMFSLEGTDLDVKDEYDINGYPTIIVIAPNNKMYETGKLNSSQWDSWITTTLALDATANVMSDAIDLEVTGGFGTISYEWSNGATTEDISNLQPDLYDVTITEGRGHSIELKDIEVTGEPVSMSCPTNSTSLCYMDDLPTAYSSISEWQEAGGNVSGSYDSNSFILKSESEEENPDDCIITTTRVYQISDFNGSTYSCAEIWTRQDIEAPVINAPMNMTITATELPSYTHESLEEFIAAGGTISDNCGIDNASFELMNFSSNNAFPCAAIEATYAVSDFCGQVSHANQSLTVFYEDSLSLDFTFNSNNNQYNFSILTNINISLADIIWTIGEDVFENVDMVENYEFVENGEYTICVQMIFPCGEKTYCEDINVTIVHTKDHILDEVSIYPNPVKNRLHIIHELSSLDVSIYNSNGVLIEQKTLTSEKSTWDTSSFTEGLYFIHLRHENNSSYRKLIKI